MKWLSKDVFTFKDRKLTARVENNLSLSANLRQIHLSHGYNKAL